VIKLPFIEESGEFCKSDVSIGSSGKFTVASDNSKSCAPFTLLEMLAAVSTAAAGLAAGGYLYAGMWPTSQLFGRTILAGGDASEFALTYDDGPNDFCTEAILEVLARYQVRATFFVIGRFVRQRGELMRRIRAAGHLLGNHTMTHPVLLIQSPTRVREELAGTNAAIEDALGERVHYFRPPHGARRPDVLRTAHELGLTPVLWNAMGHDWKPTTAEAVLASLDKGIRRNLRSGRGSNLLLHDGGQAGIGQDRSATVTATELLLSRAANVRFVTVDAWNSEPSPT
jgi:peptidoglycan/xylan/chitin deacetylase (PgdA/CDA1 family)